MENLKGTRATFDEKKTFVYQRVQLSSTKPTFWHRVILLHKRIGSQVNIFWKERQEKNYQTFIGTTLNLVRTNSTYILGPYWIYNDTDEKTKTSEGFISPSIYRRNPLFFLNYNYNQSRFCIKLLKILYFFVIVDYLSDAIIFFTKGN